MLATEVIKKKRDDTDALTQQEIDFFIQGYASGQIPDYQMASLLMSIFLNGMTKEETIHLTQSMLNSGERIDFGELYPVDKHSTGGVGDKTSLILAPIVAACGIPVPMMSGRGLGHTGGTLDKLESIPGFNVNLDLATFQSMVEKTNLSFIGQTAKICPADKKIYGLRDVTATVESLPLICASIMSKKIAEGIKGLVLDVKVGSGAFMKTIEAARELATGLISIGQGQGIKTSALITNMNQPLGRFVGNALEVGECLSILQRRDFLGHDYRSFADTESLSLGLAAHMIANAKKINLTEAKVQAQEALDSGAAFEKFAEVCKTQDGDLDQLLMPNQQTPVAAKKDGFVSAFNSESIGLAGIELGAGRKVASDVVNPLPGIEVCKKIGDSIKAGETLFVIHHTSQPSGIKEAKKHLSSCYSIETSPSETTNLILETL